jgi:hypothetical protein
MKIVTRILRTIAEEDRAQPLERAGRAIIQAARPQRP